MLVEQTLVEEGHIGLDDGHLHAVADEFEAQGFRQSVNGVFRSGIHGKARLGVIALSGHAAHVDDPPCVMMGPLRELDCNWSNV